MECVIIKGQSYPCEVNNLDIKKVYIRFRKGIVVINAPKKMKEKEILGIVQKNENKIYNLINKVNKKIKYTFQNGSEIPFYGNKYKIIYSDEECIRNGYMYLKANATEESYYSLSKK